MSSILNFNNAPGGWAALVAGSQLDNLRLYLDQGMRPAMIVEATAEADGTPPTQAANTGDSVGEGMVTTITTAKLEFEDAEQTPAEIVYTITGETNGHVRLNHINIGVGNSFTQADIDGGLITFAHDSSETTSASFAFSVSDGAGGDVTGQSFALTVAPVNDAPTITAIPPLAVVEQTAITLDPAFTVSDIELDAMNGGLGDYAGASFVINRNGNNAQDQFGFDTAGALFTVNGNSLQAGGLTFATLGFGTGTLNINFSSSETVATTALVNDVLRHLQYTNVSDAPTASYNLIYGLLDGGVSGNQGSGGNRSASQLTATTVTGINDAPVLANLNGDTGTHVEGAAPTLLDSGTAATLSDIDSSNFSGGVLRVSITANTSAGDVLGIDTTSVTLSNGTQAGSTIRIGGFQIGTVRAGGSGGGGEDLVIDLSGTPSIASRVQTLIRALSYSTSSDAPATAQRQVTITLSDGDGTDNGGADSATAVVTVDVTPTDDGVLAADDAFSTDELTVATGNLLGDNGNGADGDPDGPPTPVEILAVNGSTGNVGNQIMLASGTRLTVHADGSFSYDPNGQFTSLPGPASGASNLTYTQSFTYMVTGGDTATVTITVAGVDNNDIAEGTAGNDTIDGGTGLNTITYVAATAGVHVSLGLGGPQDTIGAGIDTLSNFAGVTGSNFVDELRGDAGNNALNGLQGADVMIGGAGNDVYFVDNAGDNVREAAGQGNDEVRASVSYTLPDREVETLTLTGNGVINGGGNRYDNVITGTSGANSLAGYAGNDRLYGFEGADVMAGGLGDDFYFVSDALDRIKEKPGEGTDTIASLITLSLIGREVENLTLSGASAIDGTGNGFANALTGNPAANTLMGYDGNDTLAGGGGDDVLRGMQGDDVMTGGAGADRFYFDGDLADDEITDFEVGLDSIWLRRVKFDGMSATGTLAADAFYIGSAAHDASDRILYDAITGALYFDPDGTGATEAVQFGTLDTGLGLTNADFTLF